MEPTVTSADDRRDRYRELILDHAKQPRHFGKVDGATHQADGINPLCGDKLRIFVRIDAGERISDIGFEGSGCAISVASASLLTETVVGRTRKESLGLVADVVASLTGGAASGETPDIGNLKALQGVRDFPSRVKCATLAWRALDAALNNETETATTE